MAYPNSSRQATPLSLAANVNNVEEGDDALEPCEQPLETLPSQPKIDINTLKNEILTDGMQVSAVGCISSV